MSSPEVAINLYKDKVDYRMLIDNSGTEPELIAEGRKGALQQVQNLDKWSVINKLVENDTEIKDKVLKGGKLATRIRKLVKA